MKIKGVKCPDGHENVWRRGMVPNRHGPKQRYVCIDCGSTFYAEKKVPKTTKKRRR